MRAFGSQHAEHRQTSLCKFPKPLSEAGAALARPETQVIVPRDDEPANLSVSVGATPSGGNPQL